MELSTSFAVRFARGAARSGPWCEVDHRLSDWAPRSLTKVRDFEVVIMVDVLIGEMVGSD